MTTMFRDGLLEGKRILVTGGGSGLGKEIAEDYARLGATVYICGRRPGPLEDTAKALNDAHPGTVIPKPLDIRGHQDVDQCVEEVFAEGPLDALVNNAAGNFISRTQDLSVNGFHAIANIVFHGTFYMTHSVGRRWIELGHRGSILSILTTWVWTGSPFVVPSAMSKSALHTMTKSLAVEWGPHGIRLNAIAPGPFPTEGAWARLRLSAPGSEDSDSSGESAGGPMGRVGKMSELQNLATFLVADGCEYLTGQTIAIDGAGYLAASGFSALAKWTDEDWARAREAIRGADAKDKAARG